LRRWHFQPQKGRAVIISHIATINVTFIDLDAVKIMAEQLGLEFVEGAKEYNWYKNWLNDYAAENAAYRHGVKPEDYGKCEHKLRVPGQPDAYEVGFVKNPNGAGYIAVYDLYGPQGKTLTDRIGKDGEKMKCQYVEAAATRQLIRQGYQVSKETLQDGTVRIVGRQVQKAYA